MRSRAAAAFLIREGFEKVVSMEGGINAWKGRVARGAPDAGMAYFGPGRTPEELTALAWALEDASRKFYEEMSGRGGDPEAAETFRELAADEERHKSSLFEFAQNEKPGIAMPEAPGSPGGSEYLEGGVPLREALEWVEGKDPRDVLDLSISLEANAIDLYIKMERSMQDGRGKALFHSLSNQERNHLKRLSRLLEKA